MSTITAEQDKINRIFKIHNSDKGEEFLKLYPTFANIYLGKEAVKKWIVENVVEDALGVYTILEALSNAAHSSGSSAPPQQVTPQQPVKFVLEQPKEISKMPFSEVLTLLMNGNTDDEVINRIIVLTSGKKVFCVSTDGKINKDATLALFQIVIKDKRAEPSIFKGLATVSIEFFLAKTEYLYLPNGDVVEGSEFEGCSEDDIRFYHFACQQNTYLIHAEIDVESLSKKTAPFKKLWTKFSALKKTDEAWKSADAAMRGEEHEEEFKPSSISKDQRFSSRDSSSVDYSNANFEDKKVFAAYLNKHFNLSEINNLCFDIDVDKDLISGDAKDARINNLIGYCVRRGSYKKLVQAAIDAMPELFTNGGFVNKGNLTVINGDLVGRDRIQTQVNYYNKY